MYDTTKQKYIYIISGEINNVIGTTRESMKKSPGNMSKYMVKRQEVGDYVRASEPRTNQSEQNIKKCI